MTDPAAGVELVAGELFGCLGVTHQPVAAGGAVEGVGRDGNRLLRKGVESVEA